MLRRHLAGLLLAALLPPLTAAAQQGPAAIPDSTRRLAATGAPRAALEYGRAAAAAAPGDPAAHAALAIGAMAAGDWDLAVEAADRLIALAPGVSTWQLVFGQAYLSHAREHPSLRAISRVRRGRAAVERAIALDPDNLDARYTLLLFLIQAPGVAGGSREQAAEQATEIARRDPARGLRARLELAATEKDPAPAVSELVGEALPVVAVGADSGGQLLGALLAAAGNLRDRELRETLTARLYAARPDDPVAAYHRARLWVIEGERLAEAERLLLEYLAGPERRAGAASRAGAHWRLAQLYRRQERDEHAEEQYRLAAALDPRLRAGNRLPPRMEAQI
jgi:tetratricopeptide (TPR) repeat protein